MIEAVGSPEPVRAESLKVLGRVQGVGFRWWARQTATHLGLTGWVRNEADGSVAIWVQGRAANLATFTAALRRGPPAARVEQVESTAVAPNPIQTAFTIDD